MKLVLALLFFVLLLFTIPHKATGKIRYPRILVTYNVIYNEDDRPSCPLAGNTPSPGYENLTVPQGTNGIQLMEAAVARSDQYRFTATYSNAGLGYFINSINGTGSDDTNSCYWTLSFKPYIATEFVLSPVGISSYYPSFEAVVQWEYKRFQHSSAALLRDYIALTTVLSLCATLLTI